MSKNPGRGLDRQDRWVFRLSVLLAASVGAAGISGCSADASFETSAASPETGPGDFAEGNNEPTRPPPDANDDPFVPEQEERFTFQAPRSSRNFVFVANSSLDTVAKIDAETLEIASIEVGDKPTIVQTNQGENLAAVLNEGSDEVTIIRAGNSDDYVRNLSITPSMNALKLAPRGDFALAWFDFRRAQEDDEFDLTDAAPPFQDVSLIKLEEGAEEVYHLTVGFQVVDVVFDDEGDKAFVITRTGISVVDMSSVQGDRAIPPIPVVEQQLEDDIKDRDSFMFAGYHRR